jgi:hypothetical protein
MSFSITSFIPSWNVVKYGAIALVLAGALGFTAYTSYTYGFNKSEVAAQAEKLKQAAVDQAALEAVIKQRQEIQNKYDTLAGELETTKQLLATEKGTTHVQVVKEIHSNPVYQSCTVPASGVQLISDQAKRLNAIRHTGSSQS